VWRVLRGYVPTQTPVIETIETAVKRVVKEIRPTPETDLSAGRTIEPSVAAIETIETAEEKQ
jgi:hypothetical protein